MIIQSVLPRRGVSSRILNQFEDDEVDDRFYFVGDPKVPSRLIALRPEKQVKGLEIPIKLIWACEEQDKKNHRQEIQNFKVQNKCQLPSIAFLTVSELMQERGSYSTATCLQIWFNRPEIHQQLNMMNWDGYKIQKIYFNSNSPNAKKEYKNKFRSGQWKDVNYGTNCLKQLTDSYFENIALPNFRRPDQYNAAHDMEKLILMAILTDQSKTQPVLKQFFQIAFSKWGSIYSKQHFKQFLDQFPVKNIIEIYTKDSFLYKFLNNFMKISKDPMELFYMQPIIKKLYNEVKQLYKKQKKNHKGIKKFFRGALFLKQEIEYLKKNKGKIVRSLGFMSTSTSQLIARSFAKNVFVTIIVNDVERNQEAEHGFADISEFSVHKHENQWIFNPLNQFRIEDVFFLHDIWNIHLVYGEIAEVRSKSFQKLTSQQKQINSLAVYDQQLGYVRNQGQILMKAKYYNIAITYFLKKITRVEDEASVEDVKEIKKQLIKAFLKKSKFNKALQQIKSIDSDQHFLSKLKGDAYFGLRDYAKAEQCYLNYVKSVAKLQQQEQFFVQLQMNFDNKKLVAQNLDAINALLYLSRACLILKKVVQAKKYSRIGVLKLSKICDARNQYYTVELLKHCIQHEDSITKRVRDMIRQFLEQIDYGEDKTVPAYIGCLILVAVLFVENEQVRDAKSGDSHTLIYESQSFYSQSKSQFSHQQQGDFYFFKAVYFYFVQQYGYAISAFQSACNKYQLSNNLMQKALSLAQIGKLKLSKAINKVKEGMEALKGSLFEQKKQADSKKLPNIQNVRECLSIIIQLGVTEVAELKWLEDQLQFFISRTDQVDDLKELYLDVAKLYIKLNQYSNAEQIYFPKLTIVQYLYLSGSKKYRDAYLLAKSALTGAEHQFQKIYQDGKKLYSESILKQANHHVNGEYLKCLSQIQRQELQQLFEIDKDSYRMLWKRKKQQEKQVEYYEGNVQRQQYEQQQQNQQEYLYQYLQEQQQENEDEAEIRKWERMYLQMKQ